MQSPADKVTRLAADLVSSAMAEGKRQHRRLWGLVAQAFPRCDHATVYDNSSKTGPRIVALFTDGYLVGEATWPAWTPAELTSHTSRSEQL